MLHWSMWGAATKYQMKKDQTVMSVIIQWGNWVQLKYRIIGFFKIKLQIEMAHLHALEGNMFPAILDIILVWNFLIWSRCCCLCCWRHCYYCHWCHLTVCHIIHNLTANYCQLESRAGYQTLILLWHWSNCFCPVEEWKVSPHFVPNFNAYLIGICEPLSI